MANEVRLIEELRRLADLTPPICSKDKASEIEVFGRSIIVYCKPFEQFQDTLRQAADRIEEMESLRPKGRWEHPNGHVAINGFVCSECGQEEFSYRAINPLPGGVCLADENGNFYYPPKMNYCPNCGAKMEG